MIPRRWKDAHLGVEVLTLAVLGGGVRRFRLVDLALNLHLHLSADVRGHAGVVHRQPLDDGVVKLDVAVLGSGVGVGGGVRHRLLDPGFLGCRHRHPAALGARVRLDGLGILDGLARGLLRLFLVGGQLANESLLVVGSLRPARSVGAVLLRRPDDMRVAIFLGLLLLGLILYRLLLPHPWG